MAPRDPDKILVIKLAPLREFVLATPAMRQIRAAHPQAHITLLTTPPFETLGKAAPYFNAVDPTGGARGFGEWFGLIGRLRGARYRRVYDLQRSAASKLIHFGMGPLPPPWSGAPREPAGPPDLAWILSTAPTERPVRDGIDRRAYALLIPGASETPPAMRWPPERYAELGRLLQKRGFDVVIVGAPQDGEVARVIQHQVPGARDLTGGPDLARIALLGARAAVVIGADTGLLHLTAATGAPAILPYPTASDPTLTAPRGHVTVLQADTLADLPASVVAQAVDSLWPRGVRSA